MSVKLTSPVLGQAVDFIYTGPLEAWLLAEGYAKRDGDTTPTSYSGVGVSNTGDTAAAEDDDPTVRSNREAASWPDGPARNVTIANDSTNLTKLKFPAPGFDFDAAGVDAEAPSNVALNPAEGPDAGGTVVTIHGDNLEGVTDVTFNAVSGTDLDVSTADDGVISVTTPAGTGAVDVVLVDASGNTTLTGGFTYTG